VLVVLGSVDRLVIDDDSLISAQSLPAVTLVKPGAR
jgi:hypothetical protein